MMKFYRILFFVLLLVFLSSSVQAEWVSDDATIMGTSIRIEIWHEDQVKARDIIEDGLNELRRIDSLMSPYIETSELALVNANAFEQPVMVSQELIDLLRYSFNFSEASKGAFDITFASVGHLYDYRKKIKPDERAIAEKLKLVDYRSLQIDDQLNSIRFPSRGMKIDLGGIAKGYAVDLCVAKLEQLGIANGVVTAGGDSRFIGDLKGKPWHVGIRDPRDEDKTVVRIPLVGEAISTSGDYERFFVDDAGQRYHHIIDPRKGDSARSSMSVSIIGPKSIDTDALSTSVFILGAEAGIELIEDYPGYEAIIIDKEGVLHFSSGLMNQ